ncbi:hypothetical protein BJ912DRAFT_900980 [Pholiota molesta]|nr:hypothetical protein BJ912DRAFT_900980 [Pholiota molesta]
MAPNFFQKLVKVANNNREPARERVSSSSDTVVDTHGSAFQQQRNRSQSASAVSSPTTPTQSSISRQSTSQFSADSRVPSIITTLSNGTKSLGKKSKGQNRSRSLSRERVSLRKSIESIETFSTQPNVTIVPPSPLAYNADLSDSEDEDDKSSLNGTAESANTGTTTPAAAPPTTAAPEVHSPTTPTPTPFANKPTAAPTTNTNTAAMSNSLAPGPYQIRKQSSNKSINSRKNAPPDINVNSPSHHARAATAPPEASDNGAVTHRPVVESPTEIKFPASTPTTANGAPPVPPLPNGGAMPPVARENTSATLAAPDSKGSKRPWKRSTTRKPTGLASAIAASGLAMANPSLSAAQHAQIGGPPPVLSPGSSKGSDKDKQPYLSRSPAQSSVSQRSHGKARSADLGSAAELASPRSVASRKSSHGSAGRRSRRPSAAHSDGAGSEQHAHASVGGDGESVVRADYYSGLDLLDDGSSDEDESGSGSDIDGLMGEDDIPVTGFAVASNKRNADFHELFPTVPEGDYLIEDYGCALQREILIQGRIYISENHICFHANIFGWITDLSIPIYEITSLEKKMTALFIPNAIQLTTRQAKYTFASFLSRDTTFDVIYNIWRLARPGGEDGVSVVSSGRTSAEGLPGVNGGGPGSIAAGVVAAAGGAGAGQAPGAAVAVAKQATQCVCGREGKHYSETAMEVVIPGTPEKIHNLMFASGFIKDFMVGNQKLLDIQMSDWAPVNPASKLLTRNMSYIKPLNGSLGPKQTKCEIKDEMAHLDFDQYITTVTTTRTPDVPSGGVFSVKTRTCIMWASAISSKVLVTTQVEWTGRSFIKGIIERSAIDGQKVYHNELEKAMRAYIQEHKSEFLPEGMDAVIVEALPEVVAAFPAVPGAPAVSAGEKEPTEELLKRRERERNARGLQWAYDTFDGAFQVGMRSAKGALELIRDAWDQSTSTTILWFVIVLLVLSNLWTLMRMGSTRVEAERKLETRKLEEREKWVHSIVTALWDELEAGKREVARVADTVNAQEVVVPPAPSLATDGKLDLKTWQEDVANLHKTLDLVEQRVKAIRESLAAFEQLDALD